MPDSQPPDAWLRELAIEFPDNSSNTPHSERRETATEIPQHRETLKPWA